MKLQFSLPSCRDSIIVVGITTFIIVLTAVYVGFRPEHVLMFGLFLGLFFAAKATRKLAVALIPFIIFGLSYDWMRVFPNYMVNPIDVKDLYDLEKYLFGINVNGEVLIPNEFFAIHYSSLMDFFAGIFYLTWVPVPIAFGVYLYLKKQRKVYLQFALVFLFVNLIGFAGYYIHPAAPPWYAMQYGFEPILSTPGNSAGLARFDELLGFSVFNSIYGRNSNVFAAVPSLHSAYMVITLFYAIKNKSNIAILITLTILMFGIWFTAVYSYHHYIIDVLLGVLCALLGIILFEYVLMKTGGFKSFFNKYYNYIK
ncbi:aureobasidin A resistance protein [Bacteroidia bacterium]|nr:aureobasidin A resistance protein [Bacteroidia bacterium]